MVKRKSQKPATEAQKRARERNWNKGQIKCLIAQSKRIRKSKTTSSKEKIILSGVINKLNVIFDNWNK